VSVQSRPLLLVFTDLDGSLLDHHDYSYHDALPQLRELERADVPVIPASSKTRVEIERLRRELRNDHPFIAENGAAVFVPAGYFRERPPGTVERDGYWIHELASRRERWVALLEDLSGDFPDEFDYFHRAGPAGIARLTGLPEARAREANQREYSEPVQWQGTAPRREAFIHRLTAAGATVLQGGRFLAVAGDCDKGRALLWLRDAFIAQQPHRPCHDIAIGDSRNDCAMLEVAETALVVRSTIHDFPPLQRREGVFHTRSYGPAGWAEGVARWLQQLGLRADRRGN
jgi:mannosyl-3-phosphoglycerate phosphatase family protein